MPDGFEGNRERGGKHWQPTAVLLVSAGKLSVLHQTASWMGDHVVVKPSALGQPTWPTQPSIPQESVNE